MDHFFSQFSRLSSEAIGEKVEREKLIQVKLPELSTAIIELAREHGKITVVMIEAHTQAKRSTIKLHLTKLVRAAHLVQNGTSRGTWYSPTRYE